MEKNEDHVRRRNLNVLGGGCSHKGGIVQHGKYICCGLLISHSYYWPWMQQSCVFHLFLFQDIQKLGQGHSAAADLRICNVLLH